MSFALCWCGVEKLQFPISQEEIIKLKQSILTKKNCDFTKKLLKKLKVQSIDQFANNQQLLSKAILDEEQIELFKDFYQYKDKYRDLPLCEMPFDDKNQIYRLSYNANKQFTNCKRILVIGKNRVGKSKFINAFVFVQNIFQLFHFQLKLTLQLING